MTYPLSRLAAITRSPAGDAGNRRFLGGLRVGTWFAGLLVAAPLFSLVIVAFSETDSVLAHTFSVTLPITAHDSVLLLAGVGLTATILGLTTAWMIALFEFPGRKLVAVALALPLAMPTYLVAYIYVALLDSSGPFQTMLRDWFGTEWFPTGHASFVRTLPGAALIMGVVLFPYIYLPVQSAIARQGANLIDAARLLGSSPKRVFKTVILPLSRPALALGLTLVLLETLNDIGASDYLGVQTFTVSIYTTWLNRGSLSGAAQLALSLMVFVGILLYLEHRARGNRRFAYQRQARLTPRRKLTGLRALAALFLCALPVTFGFVVPVLFLIVHTVERFGMTASGLGLLRQLGSTLAYSSAATICVVVVSLIVLVSGRFVRSRDVALSGKVAAFGYAVPGTVLAIGLLGPLAGFDNLIATLFRDLTHQRIGLILMGSGAALVIAYTIRFLTIGLGGIGAGFGKASPSLDDAARVLGRTPRGVFIEIHWPLLKPAITVASVLVFIDAIKELPATLLLRPLNVETLATHVYSEASRGLFENGAPAALLIVLAGILPAIISMRLFDRSHGSRA